MGTVWSWLKARIGQVLDNDEVADSLVMIVVVVFVALVLALATGVNLLIDR